MAEENLDLGVIPETSEEGLEEESTAPVEGQASEGEPEGAAPDQFSGEEGEQPPQEEQIAEQETPAWEFEFGGRKFNDPEQAKQYFQAWNGRLSAADNRFQQAMDALQQWDGWYKQHKDRIDAVLQDAEGGEKAPDTLFDAADWNTFDKLVKEGRAKEAIQYLQLKNSEFLQSKLDGIREELRGEFQQHTGPIQEQKAARGLALDLFSAAKDAQNPDGSLKFPELAEGTATFNDEFVGVLGQIWRQLPARVAFDPNMTGVELAYLKTQQLWNEYQQQLPEAGERAGQAVRDAQGRFVAQTEAQASAIGGSDTPADTEAPSETEQFSRAIKSAEGRRDNVFGVWE